MRRLNFLTFFVIIVLSILSSGCGKKQYSAKVNHEVTSKQKEEVLVVADVMPEFPGGVNNLMQWLSENINYPAGAIQQGIEGTVHVRFIVDGTGKVKSPEIIRPSNLLLDNETLRVMSLMPNWIPGERAGKKVSVYYILPVRFKLPTRIPAN